MYQRHWKAQSHPKWICCIQLFWVNVNKVKRWKEIGLGINSCKYSYSGLTWCNITLPDCFWISLSRHWAQFRKDSQNEVRIFNPTKHVTELQNQHEVFGCLNKNSHSKAWSCAQYIYTSHVVATHCNTTIYPVSCMLGEHLTPFHLVMRVFFVLWHISILLSAFFLSPVLFPAVSAATSSTLLCPVLQTPNSLMDIPAPPSSVWQFK